MTARDARRLGRENAEEIAACGDFTGEELASRDSWLAAAYEIAENRKQFAGDCTYDFRREEEWEAYEEGVNIGLAKLAPKS